MEPTEQEVKFYIADLQALKKRLEELGAEAEQPRTHELNLRFDTPDMELSGGSRALRLRRDRDNRLTYKGPGAFQKGVKVRTEIEFKVDDFDAARAFLEALGFQVFLVYEKYRAVFRIDDVEITLDELPYGSFAEIEGPDVEQIRSTSDLLGLHWEVSVNESYTVLFDRFRAEKGLKIRDLTFENFENLEIKPEDLHVAPADR